MKAGQAITDAMREQRERDVWWNRITWTLDNRRKFRLWIAGEPRRSAMIRAALQRSDGP